MSGGVGLMDEVPERVANGLRRLVVAVVAKGPRFGEQLRCEYLSFSSATVQVSQLAGTKEAAAQTRQVQSGVVQSERARAYLPAPAYW